MAKQKNEGLSRRDFLKKIRSRRRRRRTRRDGPSGHRLRGDDHVRLDAGEVGLHDDVVVIGYGYAGSGRCHRGGQGGLLRHHPREGAVPRARRQQPCVRPGPPRPVAGHLGRLQGVHHAHDRGSGLPDEHGEGYTSADTIKLYVEGSYGTRDWFARPRASRCLAANNGGGPGKWIPFYPTFPGADAIASEDQYWTNTTKDHAAPRPRPVTSGPTSSTTSRTRPRSRSSTRPLPSASSRTRRPARSSASS